MGSGKYALLELEDIHDECGGVSRSGASGRRALARRRGKGEGQGEIEKGQRLPGVMEEKKKKGREGIGHRKGSARKAKPSRLRIRLP
jgi:hypothetical protein